ncbi:MAG: hypothetical protein ABII64_08670 [Elusimicrobiota bacterium]
MKGDIIMGFYRAILFFIFCSVVLMGCKSKNEKTYSDIQNTSTRQEKAEITNKQIKITSMEMPAGYSVVESTDPLIKVKTPYAENPVTLLEMKEEKLIDLITGSEPGRFMFDSFFTGEGIVSGYHISYAVNSKGEIYFLDPMNNRIQKFSRTGKYIKSIPVPARAEKDGKSAVRHTNKGITFQQVNAPNAWCRLDGNTYYPSEDVEYYYYFNKDICYFGIDIGIDAKDDLYYLFVKNFALGAQLIPKGDFEVWQYRDDNILQKYQLKNKRDYVSFASRDGNIYLFFGVQDTFYNFINDKMINSHVNSNTIEKIHFKIELDKNNNHVLKITSDREVRAIIKLPDNINALNVIGNIYLINDDTLRLYATKYNSNNYFEGDILEYSKEGKLKAVLQLNILRETNRFNFTGLIQHDGYIYNVYHNGPEFKRIMFVPIKNE